MFNVKSQEKKYDRRCVGWPCSCDGSVGVFLCQVFWIPNFFPRGEESAAAQWLSKPQPYTVKRLLPCPEFTRLRILSRTPTPPRGSPKRLVWKRLVSVSSSALHMASREFRRCGLEPSVSDRCLAKSPLAACVWQIRRWHHAFWRILEWFDMLCLPFRRPPSPPHTHTFWLLSNPK